MQASSTGQKPSRLATISMIMPFVILIVWCVYSLVFGALTSTSSGDTVQDETAGFALLLLGAPLAALLTVAISVAGLVFAAIALRRRDPRRALAIAGLIVNFLCLLPYILFGIALILNAIPSQS